MASVLKVNTLTGVTTAGSIAVTGEGNSTTTNLQQGLAKVWLQATNAAVLEDSLNVASSTDVGTGQYSYTLSNNMGNIQWSMSTNSITGEISQIRNATLLTNDIGIDVFTRADSFTRGDQRHFISVHGDLA
jgi:hypothetical protein